MLVTVAIPIGLFCFLKSIPGKKLTNIIGLIFGVIGFMFYSLSLMLQAASVAYSINLYSEATNEFSQQFAVHLFEWTMIEGGFSTSVYILSNLAIGVWILSHSKMLKNLHPRIAISGLFIGSLHIFSYLSSWFFLMFGRQSIHEFTEAVGLLLLVWLFLIGILFLKKDTP